MKSTAAQTRKLRIMGSLGNKNRQNQQQNATEKLGDSQPIDITFPSSNHHTIANKSFRLFTTQPERTEETSPAVEEER